MIIIKIITINIIILIVVVIIIIVISQEPITRSVQLSY